MWFKKASPRRQAIREDLADVETGKKWKGGTFQIIAVAGVFFLIACLFQYWPANPLPYRLGERAAMDIKSPIDFMIDDPIRTDVEKERARLKTPPVLQLDKDELDNILNQMKLLRSNAMTIAETLPPQAPDRVEKVLAQMPRETRERFALDEGAIRYLISPEAERNYTTHLGTFLNNLKMVPIISRADWETLKPILGRKEIVDVMPLSGQDLTQWKSAVPVESVYVIDGPPSEEARIRLQNTVQGALPFPLYSQLARFISSIKAPLYHYDPKLTLALEDERARGAKAVGDPVAYGKVIVEQGKQIDEKAYQTLLRAHDEMRKKAAQTHPWATLLSSLGSALVVAILTIAGTFYIARLTRAHISIGRAWAVCGLLLAALVLSKLLFAAVPQWLYCNGLLPTLLTTIILVIAFNQRFALGVSAIQALLVTFTLGQNIDFFLTLLAGITVFAFGLAEIRTRSKLIEVGFVASVVIFCTIWAIGLARMGGSAWGDGGVLDATWVAAQSIFGVAAGLGVAMVALFILPPVERIFRITTSMTLLELCDANKPLLQRLSQEAPGTFNHSLTVGIMAEAAGNAIGANGLLCRVGAYYHDVGKLSKPQYFIENQAAGHPNRHDKLSPAMSLLIIVGHVKDGIELAREYGLPWIIHQFIGQHHGTTLVEYFFHAARKRAEQAEGGEGKAISDTEFRYPGPKPQTREAAIVMICDGCESVVRSIEEPTAGRIETAVHNMINKRLMDGQFSECDLTLRDLSIIEETLTRTLAGIHHGRVAYPARAEDSREAVSDVSISQPA